MYRRILLAYDGTAEGALALREGALLARQCCSQIVLLAVVPETPGTRLADGVYGGAVAEQIESYKRAARRRSRLAEGARLHARRPADGR